MSSIAKARPIQTIDVQSVSTFQSKDQYDELHRNLQSPLDFIELYQRFDRLSIDRSALVNEFCSLFRRSNEVHSKILMFILDCFITDQSTFVEQMNEIQFKQDFLPFFKRTLTKADDDDDELFDSILRLFIVLLERRSDLLNSALTDWLSTILNFMVNRLSSNSYVIFGHLIINCLEQIAAHFTPLPKEIVDVIGRSPSSIISTNFLNQLKSWIKNLDDTRLALFAIHLWQPLAALLSRLLTRGHTKGNEMLAVIQDAFIVGNYSIRAAAFSAWASFMSQIYRVDFQLNQDDLHQQQLSNRLLKLFLTPFLPDNTSKSKSASIAKCRAWLVLVSAYPSHIDDVLIPFLSFGYGHFLSNKSQPNNWWPECREITSKYLEEILLDPFQGKNLVKSTDSDLLNFVFESIFDKITENNAERDESTSFSIQWRAYLTHLTNLLTSNELVDEKQRKSIFQCLFDRIELFWRDSRLSTRSILNLLATFEQFNFPLAIEILDSKNDEDFVNALGKTLADQFLQLMIDEPQRLSAADRTVFDSSLRIISFFIEFLYKTSEMNFSYKTSVLLRKCSIKDGDRRSMDIFWHIWIRCATHMVSRLPRSGSINFQDDQQQITARDLLVQPLTLSESENLDFSYGSVWSELFKGLCRFGSLDKVQSCQFLIEIFRQIVRHRSLFEKTIENRENQRLFGFVLSVVQSLTKTFVSTIPIDCFENFRRSIGPIVNDLGSIFGRIFDRFVSNEDSANRWTSIGVSLTKNSKFSDEEKAKVFVLNFLVDLMGDFIDFCKRSSSIDIFLQQIGKISTILENSPDFCSALNFIGKIFSFVENHFSLTESSRILSSIYPLLIFAFQHVQSSIRIRTKKFWNETFARSNEIFYPEPFRNFLTKFRDRDQIFFPSIVFDEQTENSLDFTANDESQLSQSIEIVTPVVSRLENRSSTESTNSNEIPANKPAVVDLSNDDPPVLIEKRTKSSTYSLTENQKEKFRSPEPLPSLCDDQSVISSMDTPTIESMLTNYQLDTSSSSNSSNSDENWMTIDNTTQTNEQSSDDDVPEESSIAKKLRRSARPSTSARKSLANGARKQRAIPSNEDLSSTVTLIPSAEHCQETRETTTTSSKHPIKSILKRLSPGKVRPQHNRRVVFHDHVKVLLFTSPSRRENKNFIQQRKRVQIRDELRNSSILTRRSGPLLSQTRPSKLFYLNETQQSQPTIKNNIPISAPLTESKQNSEAIFPDLIDCDKPLDSLIHVLYGGVCPTNAINYFRSINMTKVGDIARSTAQQIEVFPIPPPKLVNIQKALSLYQERLVSSPSLSPIIPTTQQESLMPITSSSEETMVISDGTFIKETATFPSNISAIVDDKTNPSYDVDTLIDSFEYEQSYLNENDQSAPISTSQPDFIRKRRDKLFENRHQYNIPDKTCLSSVDDDDQMESDEQETVDSSKNSSIIERTLAERLERAHEHLQLNGRLPFDDDYIELVRCLLFNPTLNNLEQLHLKSLFLDN